MRSARCLGVLVTSLAIVEVGCDADPSSPTSEQPAVSAGDPPPHEATSCDGDHRAFDHMCCSLEGTWAGVCKPDRHWESTGGCGPAHAVDGRQYCCGGRYLPEQGARGFQCVPD